MKEPKRGLSFLWGQRDSPGWLDETESHSVVSNSLRPHGLYSPWNSPSQNTGVPFSRGSSQPRIEPRYPALQQILYQLSQLGSPRILEWVAYPFSRGSSWPRNWARVSCIAGGFFTSWATREAWLDEVRAVLRRPTWQRTTQNGALSLTTTRQWNLPTSGMRSESSYPWLTLQMKMQPSWNRDCNLRKPWAENSAKPHLDSWPIETVS